LGKRQR